MNEAKDFRPHFNEKELKFMLEVLKYAEHFLDSQEDAYKRLESRLYELKRQVRIGNTTVWRELVQAKEEFQNVQGYPMWILQQRNMLRSLTRRLECILKGGKAHRHMIYDYNLTKALGSSFRTKNT